MPDPAKDRTMSSLPSPSPSSTAHLRKRTMVLISFLITVLILPLTTSANSSTTPGPIAKKPINSCQQQRQSTLDGLRKTSDSVDTVYVPQCVDNDPDRWRPVQCHDATGYCWCVNVDGRPVPGSSVKGKMPNCDRLTRRRSNRRSARKGQNGARTGTSGTGLSGNQQCNPLSRVTFVDNLIQLFKSEHERSRFGKDMNSAKLRSDRPRRGVLAWKFNQLDKNNDMRLKKREIRELKRMIKKLVQPRQCAKLFPKLMDTNADTIVTRSEWFTFFRQYQQHRRGSNADAGKAQSRQRSVHEVGTGSDEHVKAALDSFDEHFDKGRPNPLDFLSAVGHGIGASGPASPMSGGGGGNGGGFMFLSEGRRQDEDEEEEEEEEITIVTSAKDCPSSRAMALASKSRSFVPECESSGLFKPIQCHESLCWCVDIQSGSPMRGTAGSNLDNNRPDCTKATAIRPQASPGLSCPPPQRSRFLEEMVEALAVEMQRTIQSRSPLDKPAVARWKFRQADGDANGLIGRSEWRQFREALKYVDPASTVISPGHVIRRHKKCFKNFLRGCDSNGDKQIESDEWLQCLDIGIVQRRRTSSSSLGQSLAHQHRGQRQKIRSQPQMMSDDQIEHRRRRGPNPFSTILKAD